MTEQEKEAAKVRDALYLSEDAADALIAGNSAGEPPFGWVGALRGLDSQRRGSICLGVCPLAPTQRNIIRFG